MLQNTKHKMACQLAAACLRVQYFLFQLRKPLYARLRGTLALILNPVEYELGPHHRLGKESTLRERAAHRLMSVWKASTDEDHFLSVKQSSAAISLVELEKQMQCQFPDLYPCSCDGFESSVKAESDRKKIMPSSQPLP